MLEHKTHFITFMFTVASKILQSRLCPKVLAEADLVVSFVLHNVCIHAPALIS